MSQTPGAHLTKAQVDALGEELDALAAEIRADLGEDDAAYIRRMIDIQRKLELGGRGTLLFSLFPPAWLAGTAMLSVAKILASMEIGHNVLHGQWDWMRDPDIHSSTWEWDNTSTSEGWKRTHNHLHHTYTNVVGKDRDLGYTVMRVSGDQPWNPAYLFQPLYNVLIAVFFEQAIALYDLEFDEAVKGNVPWSEFRKRSKSMWRKLGRQSLKDYVVWPLLANLTANVVRNVWAHTVIFCGHFPDGGAIFSEEDIAGESRGEWYLRQMEGSCNIDGGPLMHIMTGNLSFQIEHHMYPDLPSNRYQEVAPRVREICERYGIEYTSGPLHRQYLQVVKKIFRYALPGGATTEERTVDPERTSSRNPRTADPADIAAVAERHGVRAAALPQQAATTKPPKPKKTAKPKAGKPAPAAA